MGMAPKPRPPLPDGPFLVVGLARSGHGDRARAGRARGGGHRRRSRKSFRGGRACRGRRRSHMDEDGSELLSTGEHGLEEPRRARGGAGRRGRARARDAGDRRARGRPGGWSANPFVAVTGTNGKTTVTELLGPHLAHGGRAGRGRRERRHAARRVRRRDRPRRDGRLRVLELPARGLRGVRARVRRAPQHHPGPPRPPRHARATTSTPSCGSSPTRAPTTSAIHPDLSEPVVLAEDPRRRRRADRRCERRRPAGRAAAELGAARRPQRRERDGRHGGRAGAMGISADAVAAGLRTFRGVPHRLERVAEIDGVLYVNDSKATNVAAAAAALRAFPDRGVRVILGGSLEGRRLLRPRRARRRARRRRLPDRRGGPRLAHDLEQRARRRDRAVTSGDLETAVATPPPTPRRRGRPARPGLRELRRVPRLRGSAASTSGSWWRGCGDGGDARARAGPPVEGLEVEAQSKRRACRSSTRSC